MTIVWSLVFGWNDIFIFHNFTTSGPLVMCDKRWRESVPLPPPTSHSNAHRPGPYLCCLPLLQALGFPLGSETAVRLGRLLTQLRKRHDLTTLFNVFWTLPDCRRSAPSRAFSLALWADREAGKTVGDQPPNVHSLRLCGLIGRQEKLKIQLIWNFRDCLCSW